MAKTAETTETVEKVKAEKYPISRLVVTSAYRKRFTSGKGGFFGQAMDPETGDRFQIIGAVKLGG